MKKLLLSIWLSLFMITGCSSEEVTVTEMDIENVNDKIASFIEEVEITEKAGENGIYLYNDSENKRYLYLNEDFLDEGKDFGDVDIEIDEDTVYIYLTDTPVEGKEAVGYKLYKINIKENKEYLKVFKNDEETHFATIGM